jgi:hypothetical protein
MHDGAGFTNELDLRKSWVRHAWLVASKARHHWHIRLLEKHHRTSGKIGAVEGPFAAHLVDPQHSWLIVGVQTTMDSENRTIFTPMLRSFLRPSQLEDGQSSNPKPVGQTLHLVVPAQRVKHIDITHKFHDAVSSPEIQPNSSICAGSHSCTLVAATSHILPAYIQLASLLENHGDALRSSRAPQLYISTIYQGEYCRVHPLGLFVSSLYPRYCFGRPNTAGKPIQPTFSSTRVQPIHIATATSTTYRTTFYIAATTEKLSWQLNCRKPDTETSNSHSSMPGSPC